MCVKTLRKYEQDVFEDGPKRDRRLWIGDLRLQALTDYFTFRNIPLIKRCIYLFTEHLTPQGTVAPAFFPTLRPYVDGWFFADYSLCLILCLYDYLENTGDTSLPDELFDLCDRQTDYIYSVFDRKECKIDSEFFIDHPKFSRRVASLGYFAYTLNKMISLAESLGKNPDKYTFLYEERITANPKTDFMPMKTVFFVAEPNIGSTFRYTYKGRYGKTSWSYRKNRSRNKTCHAFCNALPYWSAYFLRRKQQGSWNNPFLLGQNGWSRIWLLSRMLWPR